MALATASNAARVTQRSLLVAVHDMQVADISQGAMPACRRSKLFDVRSGLDGARSSAAAQALRTR
jgi:hypothetical protein